MNLTNDLTCKDSAYRNGLGIRSAAFAALLLLTGTVVDAEIPALDRVRVLESPVTITDVPLTNQDGETFKLSQLKGRVALVFFGFTNCRDVCPLAMEQFRQLRVSDRIVSERMAFVMVSVDGERDTPEVMKSFLGGFSSDFIGLTADPEVVKPLAEQFGTAFYKQSSAHNAHEYNVSHSPQIFVLDTEGYLRAELYLASVEVMAAVTHALLSE